MTSAPDFQTDLDRVARQLRSALSNLLLAAGQDPTDPQSLARLWGVNRQLSWKVAKVVQIRDPYIALQHLPGNEGLGIILKKAEQAGLAAPVLAAVRQAADAFDTLVAVHCDDRTIFDIMGSGLSQLDQARAQQENLRKQFFLGASSIWGAQAKVNYVSWFVAPSAEAGLAASHVDVVNIKAWIGFRRLRENLSWALSRQMSRHDNGGHMDIAAPEALDPRSDAQVPLMRDFCSELAPAFSLQKDGDREVVSLDPGPLGNAGQLSFVFGKIMRRISYVRSEADQFSRFMAYLNVPSETAIFDLFVHRSLGLKKPPDVTLSSLLEWKEPDTGRNRLPLAETLIELGSPSPPPLTLEIPRYAELTDRVMERMQWQPEDFIGYRLQMDYPPVPAALVMRYELPAG